ncbi:hypothetical protein [Engelhardtia mirabilis]|uniref:hypothetical protein n=1 Tax=Engelhardtia mirabilis TaxID=2528011 RepID=UPI0011AA7C4F
MTRQFALPAAVVLGLVIGTGWGVLDEVNGSEPNTLPRAAIVAPPMDAAVESLAVALAPPRDPQVAGESDQRGIAPGAAAASRIRDILRAARERLEASGQGVVLDDGQFHGAAIGIAGPPLLTGHGVLVLGSEFGQWEYTSTESEYAASGTMVGGRRAFEWALTNPNGTRVHHDHGRADGSE